MIVLGGDGFCGWPTSLHLAAHGYRVHIVDNLVRRDIDKELLSNSLTPIRSPEERVARWRKTKAPYMGEIIFLKEDVREMDFAAYLMEFDTLLGIVHFAEQRSAPYSMVRPNYTVTNNTEATHTVLHAMAEVKDALDEDIPLVHLGTTGVYGYGEGLGGSIPEGYLSVVPRSSFDGSTSLQRPVSIPYPYNPGSVYHMTKCMDNLMFHYYVKNWHLKITDLHQGIVWGSQTKETLLHKHLLNRFDFDGVYGTVLNRFIAQAACGHPLTVYGTGGQTRAFINIQDTVRCVRKALEHPPLGDSLRIINQLAETANILQLANIVSHYTGAEIRFYDNPRNEAVENPLSLVNETIRGLGITPITLGEGLPAEILGIANKYKNRIDIDRIMIPALWDGKKTFDGVGHAQS